MGKWGSGEVGWGRGSSQKLTLRVFILFLRSFMSMELEEWGICGRDQKYVMSIF